MAKHTPMTAWDIIVAGSVVDTVFYDSDMDAETVRRSLIDHDGYDEGITVKHARPLGTPTPTRTRAELTDVQALREIVAWSVTSNAVDHVPGDTEQERASYRRDVRRRVRAIVARVEDSGDITRLVG